MHTDDAFIAELMESGLSWESANLALELALEELKNCPDYEIVDRSADPWYVPDPFDRD